MKEVASENIGEGQAITAVLDYEGKMDVDQIRTLINELKEQVTTDIIRLTRPQESLSKKDIKKIEDLTLDKIREMGSKELKEALVDILVMMPETRSFRLSGKSIYEMRMANIYKMYRKDYSEELKKYLDANVREEGKRRYMVTAVDSAFDLKMLAQAIKERREAMEITAGEKDPVQDFVVVKSDKITEKNITEVLVATGLAEYVQSDRVILVGKKEKYTPEKLLEDIAARTGKTVSKKEIAIGEKGKIINVGKSKEMFKEDSEDSLVLVQLEKGKGLASQLYRMMLEIIANDAGILDKVQGLSKENGYRLYIYLPRIEEINLEKEIKNYERYVLEVLVKA
jgi:hypothetical protein